MCKRPVTLRETNPRWNQSVPNTPSTRRLHGHDELTQTVRYLGSTRSAHGTSHKVTVPATRLTHRPNGYRFYHIEKGKLLERRDDVFLDQDTPRRAKRPRVELLIP